MKRAISAVIVSAFFAYFLAALPSESGISCSLPFNLTNGTTADASQVMANYNALASCMLNNLAESGANSSITSLSGLTTPLSPSQGGTAYFVGSNSTGTNALTVTSTTPANFTFTPGNVINFIAGAANTGPAVTLNVNGTGVKNVLRLIPGGFSANLAPGDIPNGPVQLVVGTTAYILLNASGSLVPSGAGIDFYGTSCPSGYLEANGASFVTATYPDLNTVLGSTWGAGTLPDTRGRALFGRDSGGSGRITAAGGNFDGTMIGNTGGQQNWILTLAQLPVFSQTPSLSMNSYTPTGSITINSFTPTGSITINQVSPAITPATYTPTITNNSNLAVFSAGATTNLTNGATGSVVTPTISPSSYTPVVTPFTPTGSFSGNAGTPTGSFTGNAATLTGSISAVTFGSGNSHPVLSNAAIVLKCVKV